MSLTAHLVAGPYDGLHDAIDRFSDALLLRPCDHCTQRGDIDCQSIRWQSLHEATLGELTAMPPGFAVYRLDDARTSSSGRVDLIYVYADLLPAGPAAGRATRPLTHAGRAAAAHRERSTVA